MSTRLLLLHGFMGQGSDWLETSAKLSPGFNVLAPDLPWHGSNTAAPPESWAALIDRLITEYLPKRESRIHIAGYSMGGRVALGIAHRAPERIASLTLVSSALGLQSDTQRTNRIDADAQIAHRLQSEPLKKFLQDWYALPLFRTLERSPERLSQTIASRSKNSPAALAHCLQVAGSGHMPNYRLFLETFDRPCQFLYGQCDDKYGSIAKELRTRAPRIRCTEVANTSHALLVEAPDQVGNAVNQLITRS